jgi:hypothetical protein
VVFMFGLCSSVKVEAAGIEAAAVPDSHPTDFRHPLDKRPQYQQLNTPPLPHDQTPTGHPSDTLTTKKYAHSMHKDLQEVVQAWSHLSDEVKAQIIALCRSAGRKTA